MTTPFISVVIPTYNEAENIVTLLAALHDVLQPALHEVIVVDDDSPDRTWQAASDYARMHRTVRVHRRVGKRGLSSAVIDGFNLATGQILAVMDADLSHDERILPELIRKVEAGADLAIGSRRIPGGGATEWPWYRRMTSSVATLMAKSILGVRLSDPMSGFFALPRALYESCRARLRPEGYKILLEIYCKGRTAKGPLKIEEVPFVFRNRRQGYSKLSGWVMWQYCKMLVTLKLDELKRV